MNMLNYDGMCVCVGVPFGGSFSLGSYTYQVTFCFNKWCIVIIPVLAASELIFLRHLVIKPLAWTATSKTASLDLANQIQAK